MCVLKFNFFLVKLSIPFGMCVKIQFFFVKLTIPFGSIIANNVKRKHCTESVTVNLETL